MYLTGNESSRGNILITGAIGDYGKVRKIKGQKDFSLVKLHKSAFEINTSKLMAAVNSTTPTRNTATCSYLATALVAVLDGTGLYAGISGTPYWDWGTIWTWRLLRTTVEIWRLRPLGCPIAQKQGTRKSGTGTL